MPQTAAVRYSTAKKQLEFPPRDSLMRMKKFTRPLAMQAPTERRIMVRGEAPAEADPPRRFKRTITAAEVFRAGDCIIFRVCANGFLYNMVRILAGTLLLVGQGKLTPEDVARITESRDRTQAGATMPAGGLYLNRVIYP